VTVTGVQQGCKRAQNSIVLHNSPFPSGCYQNTDIQYDHSSFEILIQVRAVRGNTGTQETGRGKLYYNEELRNSYLR
jgi:hypothetical protein